MVVMTAGERPFKGLGRPIGQLQRGYFGFSPSDTWSPAVNLYETDQSYLICVDLAGVVKSKIDIQLEHQQITIRGAREAPVPANPCDSSEASAQPTRLRVHLMEIDHGSFSRQVEIPSDVQRESIQAVYRDGLLWIELPKIDSRTR